MNCGCVPTNIQLPGPAVLRNLYSEDLRIESQHITLLAVPSITPSEMRFRRVRTNAFEAHLLNAECLLQGPGWEMPPEAT
jgi:hypothetical protein